MWKISTIATLFIALVNENWLLVFIVLDLVTKICILWYVLCIYFLKLPRTDFRQHQILVGKPYLNCNFHILYIFFSSSSSFINATLGMHRKKTKRWRNWTLLCSYWLLITNFDWGKRFKYIEWEWKKNDWLKFSARILSKWLV